MELHVYRNKIVEWVVAASPEDAAKVLLHHHDGSADPEELDLKFAQEPDDKLLRIVEYDGPGGDNQTLSCKEWASINGRGFLCSTEF